MYFFKKGYIPMLARPGLTTPQARAGLHLPLGPEAHVATLPKRTGN